MTRQELINAVKVRIDELTPPDGVISLAGLVNDKPVDVFADGLLDECAREIQMSAPAFRLRPETGVAQAVDEGDGTGHVVLPDGFLRLVEFKMKEWRRPVSTAAEAGSDVALRQHAPFTRGGCCKPVCVFGHRDGLPVLEYYSVRADHSVERFSYVRDVPAEDIPVDLQDALAWWCASRLLEITGRTAAAQSAHERGKRLL